MSDHEGLGPPSAAAGIRGAIYERLRDAGEKGIPSTELEDLVSQLRLGAHLESLRAEGHRITAVWTTPPRSRVRGWWHVTLTYDAWA